MPSPEYASIRSSCPVVTGRDEGDKDLALALVVAFAAGFLIAVLD